jgi:predicted transcriptional regulator
VSQEALSHAAALLVQSVEPMLAEDSPRARRVLRALRSKNPLANQDVANAFGDALLQLHDLAADLELAGGAGQNGHLSPRVLAAAPVAGPEDGSVPTGPLIAKVQRALAATLNGNTSQEAVSRAATLVVQSVEPMLAEDSPRARRILRALRSKNPLADRKVAEAFGDSLLELQDLAAELGLPAKEALA